MDTRGDVHMETDSRSTDAISTHRRPSKHRRDRSCLCFGSIDGLYRGETSFLDWRAQTYPQWMVDTPAHIAMSKSLSTNLSHLYTLRALEELTNEDWGSAALAITIDEAFWNGTSYSSFCSDRFIPLPCLPARFTGDQPRHLGLGNPSGSLASIPAHRVWSTGHPPAATTHACLPQPSQLVPSYLPMHFLPPNSLTTDPSLTHNSMLSSKAPPSIYRTWRTGKSKRVKTGTKMASIQVPSSIHAGNSGLLPDLLAL